MHRSAESSPHSALQVTACGRLLVCPEVANPGKSFPTLVTTERLLPSVDSLVLLQVPSLREAFPAGVATERLLPCVDSLMGFQIGKAGENLATDFAYVTLPVALPRHHAASEVFVVARQSGCPVQGWDDCSCGSSHC